MLVVDLTTEIDGPYSTKLLADLGARVVKVEPLEGDPARRFGPFPTDVVDEEASGLFLYLNANKESVTADITRAAGRDLIAALAARADILVENFEPGAMARYGLSFETLHSANRRLVVTSLTPFGQYGPYAQWKGPEIVRQAVGGWLIQGGLPDRRRAAAARSANAASLYVSGACCAGATLIAYLHARATGEGQHVDVSAMEALITCSGQEIYKASRGQVTWTRLGHQSLPFVMVPCRDGWVGINLLFDRDWVALCELSGMTDLLEDPRFDKLAKLRLPGRAEELNGRLRDWALRQEKTWLVAKAQERRIPVVYVPTMPEVMESPQHLARNFLRRVEHSAGSYVQPGPPFQLSVTPWRITRGAPTLGSSNDAIEELLSALPASTELDLKSSWEADPSRTPVEAE